MDQRPDLVIITGDATQDDLLRRAAVPSAAGLFAVTGDDAHNLVITLSAKHMNPALRVIARVHERHNEGKMLRIGADAIVSPDFSGAVRASALMIRPQVVSVLDRMMRTETGVKLEEYVLPADMKLRNVGEIGHSHDWFVLALRRGERWRFNPEPTETLEPGETVVVLLSERGRPALMRALGLA
ncbi:MAG: NAD-binding protein [Burkholderiaceae bacterium]